MHVLKYFSFVLICLVLSCGTESDPNPVEWDGSWKVMGLESREIIALELTDEHLFAADTVRIFRYAISNDFSGWDELDFEIDGNISQISDLLFTGNELYVTVSSTAASGVPAGFQTLYRSPDGGNTWEYVEIESIGEYSAPYSISEIEMGDNNRLYTISGERVFRSENSGMNWIELDHEFGPDFIYVNSYSLNQVWIGGHAPTFHKYLEVSHDYGDTWEFLSENKVDGIGDGGNVYTIVVNPEKPDLVLAGTNGTIRKSADGGDNWEWTLQGFIYFALRNSLIYDDRVYASGWNPGRNGVFILISDDFGDTWDIEEYSFGDGGVPVTDMVIGVVNGEEIVYLASESGVFAYRRQ